MAMQVLHSNTVDSATWTEAVRWLLIYGPPEVREMMLQASSVATNECFPALKVEGFSGDGQICYDLQAVAQALEMPVEELRRKMMELEEDLGENHLFDKSELHKIQ